MLTNRELIIVLTLTFLMFIFISIPVFAPTVTRTSEVNITVNITPKVMVDINPKSLSWYDLEPGSEGARKDVQIENIGSVNITAIWFNNTYPSSRPFGTAVASNYDAGNFVVVSRDGLEDYYFPNRVEYNESQRIVYLIAPDGSSPPDTSKYSYGRFRNSSFEYFWILDRSVSTNGNCTDADLYIGTEPHTATTTGDVDFTDNSAISVTPVNAYWGYAAVNINGMLYCAAVYYLCDVIHFYKWNMDEPGAGLCANAEYFTTQPLAPGASTYANVRVRVPYGVYYGDVNQGTLTVIAQGVE
jgi:hypothetical protein